MGRLAAYVAGEVGCRNIRAAASLRQRATVMASAIRLPSYKSHSPPIPPRGLSASQLQTRTTVGFEGFEGGERGVRSQTI